MTEKSWTRNRSIRPSKDKYMENLNGMSLMNSGFRIAQKNYYSGKVKSNNKDLKATQNVNSADKITAHGDTTFNATKPRPLLTISNEI